MEHVGDQRVQIGLGHIVIARLQVEGGTDAGLAARQVSLVTLPRVEESRPSLILDGNVKILPGLGDIRIPILPMGKGGLRDHSRQGKRERGVGARASAVVVEEGRAVFFGSTWSTTTRERAHPPWCRQPVR